MGYVDYNTATLSFTLNAGTSGHPIGRRLCLYHDVWWSGSSPSDVIFVGAEARGGVLWRVRNTWL